MPNPDTTAPQQAAASGECISDQEIASLLHSLERRVYPPDQVPTVLFQRATALCLLRSLAAAREERDEALALFQNHRDEPQPECFCEDGDHCPVYDWIDRDEEKKRLHAALAAAHEEAQFQRMRAETAENQFVEEAERTHAAREQVRGAAYVEKAVKQQRDDLQMLLDAATARAERLEAFAREWRPRHDSGCQEYAERGERCHCGAAEDMEAFDRMLSSLAAPLVKHEGHLRTCRSQESLEPALLGASWVPWPCDCGFDDALAVPLAEETPNAVHE